MVAHSNVAKLAQSDQIISIACEHSLVHLDRVVRAAQGLVVAGRREEGLRALLNVQSFQVVLERRLRIAALPGELSQPNRGSRMRRVAAAHLLEGLDRLVALPGKLEL